MTFREIAAVVNGRVAEQSPVPCRFGMANATHASWGCGTNNATLHRHTDTSPLRMMLQHGSGRASSETYDGDLNDPMLRRVGDRIVAHLNAP